jgi:hypothetical protein
MQAMVSFEQQLQLGWFGQSVGVGQRFFKKLHNRLQILKLQKITKYCS